MSHLAVVGGSLAGLRSAEQLRAAGHTGPITVYGQEPHLPYNRPPLSKELLKSGLLDVAAVHDKLAFRRRASVDDVHFATGRRVEGADLAAGRLDIGGTSVAFDGLVIATGLRPRQLDLPGPTRGRHVLRTIEDCVGIATEVRDAQTAVVIGAGFIGTETACTLHSLGVKVTVVEPAGAPMERVLGTDLARAVQHHLEAAGLRFEIGLGVLAYTGNERATGVELNDGRVLPADLLIEAVGSRCNTEWLAGNGLDLTDGVLTTNDLAVVGVEKVVAVGDIARFPNPLFDDIPRRVEHWSMPTDTAKRAARTLLAQLDEAEAPTDLFTPIPSFWSDQLDLRLQSVGSPALADEVKWQEGSPDALTDGVLVTYHRAGRHVGTVAVNLNAARQRSLREAFTHLQPTC